MLVSLSVLALFTNALVDFTVKVCGHLTAVLSIVISLFPHICNWNASCGYKANNRVRYICSHVMHLLCLRIMCFPNGLILKSGRHVGSILHTWAFHVAYEVPL